MRLLAGHEIVRNANDFEKLQSLEFLTLIGSGAGAIAKNQAIMCNGANLCYERKVYDFDFDVEENNTSNPATITFRVYSIPRNIHRHFEYTFSILDEETAKGETADHHNLEEFVQKGLPEKIIEIASEVLNRDIKSSPITPQPGNFLIAASKKAWERLIQTNPYAEKDLANDCFVLRRRPH